MGEFQKQLEKKKVDIIYSAHYMEGDWDLKEILEIVVEAKKEFPKPHLTRDYGNMESNCKFWSTPSYKEVKEWFERWFGMANAESE